MRLLHIVGARPNFMKAAPVWLAVAEAGGFEQELVHTGQHYDVNMSDIFFAELGLPAPHYHLGVGSGTHAQQTAAVMVAFEKTLAEARPDLVLVYGDVNSTVAAALVCAKLLVPVAHVEAGLRSGDRTMPEEINRLLTDQIADLLFTPSADGDANLLREGVAPEKIVRVGNVMIDSLVRLLPLARRSGVLERLGLAPRGYAALTLHRPSNVDDPARLRDLLATLGALSARLPIVFPVHPRTRKRIEDLGLSAMGDLRLTEPLGYLEFLHLMSEARLVLTDSGGIQEETSYLGVPCLTLRANTERPITVDHGTNTLVGPRVERLAALFNAILDGDYHWDRRPSGGIPLWDGQAARRIVAALERLHSDTLHSVHATSKEATR
ncbi:MAG: UDP-N-acetylglucosamine 2-epimerase (non-hydrolyzing) [Oscillochloridaceae bacterium]|nr:UDP-N-acetylglucosamine 2-epimerase (non-hydrolyzing) [Chloroflexaceae bacterium]MDW8388716.1 UDP-N-acetylglucosamine 2-epimerase (non-hydrolyzing) [Oscillochloridaceae bacterium]